MGSKPLVSIIMPAYNAERTIAESIKSVLNQTYIHWELLIINDGSKDNTSNIIKSIKDNRIILIEQENGGVAKARNNGIQNAKGKYVAFLDSDDLWLEEKLDRQIKHLAISQCKLSYSKTLCFKDNPNQTSDCLVTVALNFEDKDKILIYDFIPILTVLVEKNILDEVGYFDETLQGTEDWDLWIRILQKHDALYLDDFLTKYRISSTGLSGNLEKHFLEEEKVWKKNIALYTKKTNNHRQWFSYKKQALIAKKNNNVFSFLQHSLRLLKSPRLLVKFLMAKYN